MNLTGIFYHQEFSRRSFLTVGRRLADFPEAFDYLLKKPNVVMKECRPVAEDLLGSIHTQNLIRKADRNPLCSTARLSAGGVAQAVEEVISDKLSNAFAFIGAGGHHAGRDYFWGYCCFNDVMLAVVNARRLFGTKRFAILDTDAHHGDGTRELCEGDRDILHVCLCDEEFQSNDETKHDVNVSDLRGGEFERDHAYITLIRSRFLPLLKNFRPDMIIWYFGFDTHASDYGNIGLTENCYPEIASIVLEAAKKYCGGRLVVVLGGGSRTDLATLIIPKIIERLAG